MNIEQSDFTLVVSDDRLSVLLDCDVPRSSLDLLLDNIESQLKACGVTGLLEREPLCGKLAAARDRGEKLSGQPLVQGLPPVPPTHALLQWAGDFFGGGFAADERTGRIDYRRHSAQPDVVDGQLLATLTPPAEGKPGTDVFGKRIPVPRANRLRLRVGPNVREVEKDGIHVYYATAGGRVRWAADTLAVDTVLTIDGDVGLETGDIRHNGAVIVRGDVRAGSHIQAQGDIDVHGSVEPADIQTGGNLTVQDGITGSSGRTIAVGGAVRAKYLVEVTLEAGGDIDVENEIIHCSLKTRGGLHLPGGRLIGGEVVALRDIVLDEAGSDYNVPTRLLAGEDYCLARELKPRTEELARQQGFLGQIRQAVASLEARRKILNPRQRESLTELIYNDSLVGETIQRLQREIQELEDAAQNGPRPQIAVKGRIYPEVLIQLKNATLTTTEELGGPLRIVLVNGQVHVQSDKNAGGDQ